jgi:hypothetical protein
MFTGSCAVGPLGVGVDDPPHATTPIETKKPAVIANFDLDVMAVVKL